MIEGLKVKLRGLEISDAEIIMQNWNNLELRTFLASRLPNSVEEEREFIKATWSSKRSGNIALGIETVKEQKLIGTIGFDRLWSLSSGTAEVGIAIWEPEERSKGYGQEALFLLSFYAFEVLRLHRLQLHILSFNKRAIKAYTKVGYKEIGRLREADFIYGKFHDMVLMDLLEHEVTYPDELNKKIQLLRDLTEKNH